MYGQAGRPVSRGARIWSTFWFGPVLDLRVWLMGQAVLVMLALDAWVLMIERGGRYGAGGFNVAHFAWLDGLQPVPTSALYVGLILTCGVVAMFAALGVLSRLCCLLLLGLYTYGWAMSQLDSYQHHVFISWVLLALCCFPRLKLREVLEQPREVCAWGYRLLIGLIVVLYVFTGISKTEPQWLSGGVLKRINSGEGVLTPLVDGCISLGFDEATVWVMGGYSVVALQWAVSLLWMSALIWGEGGGCWVRLGRFVGVLLALSFHLGAELVGLRIGWFSWYMIALTLIAFAPSRMLVSCARLSHRALGAAWTRAVPSGDPRAPWVWGALCLAGMPCLLAVGRELDLPGTQSASIGWCVLVALAVGMALRGQGTLRRIAFAASLTAASLGLTMDSGRVRYDFYRYVGGDATRRLELQVALDAYGRANTYAPEGEGRWKKVVKVKRLMHTAR